MLANISIKIIPNCSPPEILENTGVIAISIIFSSCKYVNATDIINIKLMV